MTYPVARRGENTVLFSTYLGVVTEARMILLGDAVSHGRAPSLGATRPDAWVVTRPAPR